MDEVVTATVRVESDTVLSSDVEFEATYDLQPGERVLERTPFEAAADLEVVVTITGDSFEDRWGSRSCRRHGVAIVPDGIEAGWLEPLQGPADTQHDCYPGDEIPIDVVALERARTVPVDLVDRCAGERFEETVGLDGDVRERIEGELESGGVYDVTIHVDDGVSETYEFREGCWGLNATIETDGSVRLYPFGID